MNEIDLLLYKHRREIEKSIRELEAHKNEQATYDLLNQTAASIVSTFIANENRNLLSFLFRTTK